MRTIWLGWNIVVVIAFVLFWAFTFAVILTIRIWKRVRAARLSARLVDAGFTWEHKLQGWLSRDPYNGDWILWDERKKRMLRLPDQENFDWRPSGETFEQCIDLGQKYRVRHGYAS